MKNETPRTTALIADIVQNPGLEWTRAEVEQLGEHAFQLERELNQWQLMAGKLAEVIIEETDCDADESCPCKGCQTLHELKQLKEQTVAAMPNEKS
jgi:hypothetical protein